MFLDIEAGKLVVSRGGDGMYGSGLGGRRLTRVRAELMEGVSEGSSLTFQSGGGGGMKASGDPRALKFRGVGGMNGVVELLRRVTLGTPRPSELPSLLSLGRYMGPEFVARSGRFVCRLRLPPVSGWVRPG